MTLSQWCSVLAVSALLIGSSTGCGKSPAAMGKRSESTGTQTGADSSTPNSGGRSGRGDNPNNSGLIGQTAGSGGKSGVGPASCGDAKRADNEACDDGNRKSGDGCSGDCLGIEAGFSCPPGKPCRVIARCGDSILASSEVCDDGNSKDGDGCTSHCKLESGWKCSGEPSACSATRCGDGKQEGAESCDDGNGLPFDGCSASCQTEPNCKSGACSSKCGDGLVLNEECDDGNDKDGDGCSASCKAEAGFKCTTETSCLMHNGHCIVRVPAIYRDFDERTQHDFGVGCGQLVTGLVQDKLSADGKPVLTAPGACIESAASFAEWYTGNPKNASIVGSLTLYDNGKGGYVNRHGADGEQWLGPLSFTNIMYGGMINEGCGMCTPSANGKCFDPCVPWNSTNQACCADAMQMAYDGEPLFFPIDNAKGALAETLYRAKIPEQYGYNGWPWEDAIFAGAPTHNFHFTTEVVYWFKYDAKTTATLDFTGDDDVWVFVNGRLAVDLGGPHVPTNGTLTIDTTTAPSFGLSPNNVYEIRVFHAERKVEGSSFKLTLSGFNTSPSDCTPICGDSIVTLGEECDDGVNDGGYEECAQGCVLGPRCGDAIVQTGEDCDDGNRRDGDDCGSSCRNLVLF